MDRGCVPVSHSLSLPPCACFPLFLSLPDTPRGFVPQSAKELIALYIPRARRTGAHGHHIALGGLFVALCVLSVGGGRGGI